MQLGGKCWWKHNFIVERSLGRPGIIQSTDIVELHTHDGPTLNPLLVRSAWRCQFRMLFGGYGWWLRMACRTRSLHTRWRLLLLLCCFLARMPSSTSRTPYMVLWLHSVCECRSLSRHFSVSSFLSSTTCALHPSHTRTALFCSRPYIGDSVDNALPLLCWANCRTQVPNRAPSSCCCCCCCVCLWSRAGIALTP